MLPGFLESTYARYKNDTSIFIKWLCESGSKCGYTISIFKDETPVKTTRLKGKVRKRAKAASKGAPNPKSASKGQTVSLKELLPLAHAVANSKDPLIAIPSEIMRAGIRAVSARKRCAGYFANNANPRDSKEVQANRGHSYFISLMEDVIMALQPCFSLSAGAKSGKGEPEIPSHTVEDLENRFMILEVEQLMEQSEDIPSTNSSPAEPTYQVETPKDQESAEAEKFFALFCLFDDLQNLRGFLEKLWIEYGAGKIELITASVTTNAGFQLALRTQEEMLAAYPECGDYQSVLSSLMVVFSNNGRTDEIEIDDRIVKWMFAPAHQLLDSFCDILNPNEVPLMKRGHFGVYNPRLDRSKLSDAQRQNQDLILLVELLPEFCFIQRYNVPQFAMDELTRGLIKMVETKKIPIWLTFATTVLLDIHHTLRDRIDIAFNQLQEIGKYASRTLSRYFEFSSNIPRPSTWPKKNEHLLRELSQSLKECILKDMIFPLKTKAYKKLGSAQKLEDRELFYLYKRHPVLCGILAFRTVLEMQYTGVTLCNAWGTVMYPAHFYNALRQKSKPVQPWPMMDQVMAIHTEERLFLGAAPKTIVDSFKQVSLILGYSASQFTSSRRDQRPTVSKNGPRGLKETSVLGELFREGLSLDGGMAFTLHNVEALLTEQAAASANEKYKPTLNAFTKTHRLTSLQLLSALSTTIPLELPKLKFDYFAMHEQSISLLRRLKQELDPELRKYFGPLYLENESQLPFVGLYVVMVACGSSKIADHIGLSVENVESKLLEKAGGIFDEFVKEQDISG